MSRQIEYRKRLQAQGLCPVCRNPMDREGYSCTKCLENENARHREDTRAIVALGICRICQKNKSAPNSTYCEECSQKMYEYNRKRYLKNPDYFRESNKKSAKKTYDLRKSQGICTRCGKRKPEIGKTKCRICLDKDAERHALKFNGISYENRKMLGICRFCGNPVKEGYRVCEKHYQMCCEMAKRGNERRRGA